MYDMYPFHQNILLRPHFSNYCINFCFIKMVERVLEEPHKVPLLITLSDGCYAQFPVIILPSISCRLAGVRLAVIDSDFHRGDETILNFATVC